MISGSRLVLPLAAALLLGAALALRFFLPAPEVEPQFEEPPVVRRSAVVAPVPESVAPVPVRPTPVKVAAPVVVARQPLELEAPEDAAPVPAPQPEVAPPPPEDEAPAEPEKPQQKAWKSGWSTM